MNQRVKPELIISILALVMAFVSTIASIYFSYINLQTSVLPTLVLVYGEDSRWEIQNVGNGPALNITVAHQSHDSDSWEAPTRLYPLPKNGVVLIPWVGHNPDKIGVTYIDVHNNEYTSITDEDLTRVHKGRYLPIWKRVEIKRIWQR